MEKSLEQNRTPALFFESRRNKFNHFEKVKMREVNLLKYFALFGTLRAKICGQAVGKNGTLEATNTLASGEFCIFKVFPETREQVSFGNISRNIISESDKKRPRDAVFMRFGAPVTFARSI